MTSAYYRFLTHGNKRLQAQQGTNSPNLHAHHREVVELLGGSHEIVDSAAHMLNNGFGGVVIRLIKGIKHTRIAKHIAGKTVRKVIIVPRKLVNIVAV